MPSRNCCPILGQPAAGKIAYSFVRARTVGISSIRARAVSVIYPLHTGELGGPLLMTVLGVDGLALFGLSVTGVWQWWRRRKARRMPSGTRSR